MGKLFDRIFRRKHYKDVNSTYSEVLTSHITAFNLFIQQKQIKPDDSYEFKEYITDHYFVISQCSRQIKTARELFLRNRLGFILFCREQNLNNPQNVPIQHYRIVYENREKIIDYDEQANKYKRAQKKYPKAIKAIFGPLPPCSIDDIKNRLSQLEDIKKVDSALKSYSKIETKYQKALKVLFGSIPACSVDDIQRRLSQLEDIKKVDSVLKSYSEIETKYQKAIKYQYKKSKLKEYSDKEDAVSHRSELVIINQYILKVETIKTECPLAWNLFLKSLNLKDFYDLPLEKIKEIKKNIFSIKEQFLCTIKGISKTALKLISPKDLDISQFTTTESKLESRIIELLTHLPSKPVLSSFECTVPNPERDQYVRVILKSKLYGSKVRFSDAYTIEDFYSLRRKLADCSTGFDIIAYERASNSEAIKKYNLKKTGKAVFYIEDFELLASKDPELMQCIQDFNREKEQKEKAEREKREKQERENTINKARSLADTYTKGFEHFFPDKSIYSIDYSTAQDILWKESQIKEWSNMVNRVSSWDTVKGIPYYFFWYYFPKNRFTKVSPESDRARKIVWNFKDGKTTDFSVADLVAQKLRDTFSSSMLRQLTFVCVPASSRSTNEIRYKLFSSKVCESSGVRNAFSYIDIIKEKTPAHLSPTHEVEPAEYSFDRWFFNNANVILFDDIITTGRSLAAFKRELESLGANVICAISIGRTYSDYYGDNRKPHPYTGTL